MTPVEYKRLCAARRAYRRLCAVRADEFEEGMFPSAIALVAARFGFDQQRLDELVFDLEEDEYYMSSPACPFHERGLECRNSAPAGIDADGEPYGDRGCGCDRDRLRSAAVRGHYKLWFRR